MSLVFTCCDCQGDARTRKEEGSRPVGAESSTLPLLGIRLRIVDRVSFAAVHGGSNGQNAPDANVHKNAVCHYLYLILFYFIFILSILYLYLYRLIKRRRSVPIDYKDVCDDFVNLNMINMVCRLSLSNVSYG